MSSPELPTRDEIVAAAHRYVALGMKVIPVHGLKVVDRETGRRVCDCDLGAACDSAGKHPYEKDWPNRWYDHGPDLEELFREVYPNANLGIVTGEISGCFVLDIDQAPGRDGAETMHILLNSERDFWLAGRIHITGSGGRHHFLQWPRSGEPIKSRSDVFWRSCGIDVRGERGFVVAPPSMSLKGAYSEWHNNPIPRAPDWLLWRLREAQHHVGERLPLPEWEEPPGQGCLSAELERLLGELSVTPRYRHLWRIAAAARRADLTIGQSYALALEWVRENERAHEDVPGKWTGAMQARCVAADTVRNWSKLDNERNALVLRNPFVDADPEAVDGARAEIETAITQPRENPLLPRLARYVPDLDAAAASVTLYPPVDWHEVLENEPPPPDWLVPPLCQRGRYTLLYSREGHGKSLVMQQQMGAVVAGRILADDGPLAPANVLYLDMENNVKDLHKRYHAAGFKAPDLERLKYLLLDDLPPLNTVNGARELFHLVLHYQADVIVLDTMSCFLDGELNSPDAPNGLYRNVVRPLTSCGVGLIVLDHMAKDERVTGPIGSSAKTAKPDVVWRLVQREENRLRLTLEKDRQGDCPEFIRVRKSAEPLNFTFEPLAKKEAEREDALDSLNRRAIDSPRRKPGRPPVPDDDKIDAVVVKLDTAGVPLTATWREARDWLHGEGFSVNDRWLGPALDRRRDDR